MKSAVVSEINTLKEQTKSNKSIITKLEVISKRVVVKGNNNLVGSIAKSRIAVLTQEIAKIDGIVVKLKECTEELKNYSYDVDKANPTKINLGGWIMIDISGGTCDNA